MNTTARRIYLTDSLRSLSLADAAYRTAVKKICSLQLELDDSGNDATTQVVFGAGKEVREAFVIAKSVGMIAGIEEVAWFLTTHAGISAKALVKNGAKVSKGAPLLSIKGSMSALMSHERMILNMIGHLSGIATHTHEQVSMLGPVKNAPLLASTRKTRFGVLDKAACVAAGAGSHRLTLKDAVIIKHNHLHARKSNFESVLKNSFEQARKLSTLRFFEVEVTTPRDALTAAQFFETHKNQQLPAVLMLDNFPPPLAQKLIMQLNRQYPHRAFVIEVSGGINKSNLRNYAKVGADVLSLGSLTYSAPFFDVSMRMK